MEPVLPVVALPAPEAEVEPVLPVPVHLAVEPTRSAQQVAGRECRSAMEVVEPVPGLGQSDPSSAQVAMISREAFPVPQPLPYR